jgi:putative ABC transport system substrate-binding protein
MPVIGHLTEVPDVEHLRALANYAAFHRGMAELGYVEGKNFATEYRTNPESLPQAAADLVRRNVNAIVASGPAALAALSKATTSIPVVGIDLESDPVATGYVESLARPGGNITGIFLDIPELSGKQLGLLIEIVPRLSSIAIFGVPSFNAPQFAATETAARGAGVEVEILEVRVADDLHGAMEAASMRHVEAGVLLSSPLVFTSLKLVAELALANRLPLISLLALLTLLGRRACIKRLPNGVACREVVAISVVMLDAGPSILAIVSSFLSLSWVIAADRPSSVRDRGRLSWTAPSPALPRSFPRYFSLHSASLYQSA